MPWAQSLLLAALLLAGCAAGPAEAPPAPDVEFGAMSLETVPLEPFEARGVIRVAWAGDLFAVHTKGEGGMPAMAVRQGSVLYTTETGMGWTSQDVTAFASSSVRGFRYLAWDVPALLEEGRVTSVSEGRFEAESDFNDRNGPQTAGIVVLHDGHTVTEARVTTAADPESPYTLRPAAGFPFPVAVPSPSRPVAEVLRMDATARDVHAGVLKLVADYSRNHAGSLPDRLDPDALRVEMLASGASWPEGAYDGQPLHEASASGQFHWVHCALNDGVYEGYGWDGAAVRYAFGRGCA
ncbi:MAG: hypothetical protein QOJ26_1401 [Thermoplasmata archaeon]|jgi:hypothetical protein|nr:hypothetical protein [Thermoplasmata archaeon]